MRKSFFLILPFVFFFFVIKAQTPGCPDPAANNYNVSATVNDGSCTYSDATITPKLKYNLNTQLNESSGVIWWKKLLWSHNDSGNDPVLFAMNTTTSDIQKTVTLSNATNIDWEDIAQDKKFIYIGDFGNNANGNRTDLKIYKIAKADVLAGNTVTASVINFSYDDQTDFTPKSSNNTNFDCEAMIAFGDSLYLFSKDWVDNKTRLYKLPNKPGTFSAVKLGELNVQGLITGADILPDQRVIVLSGYSLTLSPFIYLLYDFSGNHFFDANKRKILLNQSFTQAEGICAKTATTFFLSNERFSKLGITTPAKLQQLNLSPFLNPYYSKSPITTISSAAKTNISENNKWASVSNGSNWLRVNILSPAKKSIVEIYNVAGYLLLKKNITGPGITIDLSSFTNGIYVSKIYSGNKQLTQNFIKE
ncbi:MAG TPA: T9SS type A sorting domain-containing protein [Chitinophagaceae bacterium]